MNKTNQSSWKEIIFEKMCKNVSERVNPQNSGYERYVGLEHLETLEPEILEWGSTDDVKSNMTLFKKGQILFGRRNWYLRRVAITNFDGVCSADIYVLKPIEGEILKDFLPIFLHSNQFFEKCMMYSAGSMSTRVKWSDLSKIKFDIPSITKQEKIVELFNIIDKQISFTRSLQNKLRIYKNSKTYHLLTTGLGHTKFKKKKWMFNTQLKIPQDWDLRRLGDFIEDFQPGFSSGQREPDGVKQLRPNNITQDGEFNFDSIVEIPSPVNVTKFQLRTNDVLFNNTNSVPLIGKTAFVDEDMEFVYSNHMTRIRTKEKELDPQYLQLLLMEFKRWNVFKRICHRHVNQAGIGREELFDISIIYPPPDEQKTIATTLSKLTFYEQSVVKYLRNLKLLRRSFIDSKLVHPVGE